MQIRVLGCSGGISAGARTSSILVDDDVLLDAGSGVGDLELEELRRIRHVFLTHSHLDHISALPLLIDCMFDSLSGETVTVYARPETLSALKQHIFNWVIWPDFSTLPSPAAPVLRYCVLNPGECVDVRGRRFTAVEVEHTVPSQGYVVTADSGSFAVSGDTRTNESLWPALNAIPSLEALIVEVSFPNEQIDLATQSGHYVPVTMASDLKRLEHDPAIWLNAMKPGEEQRILNEVRHALPGREIQMLEIGTELSI